MPSIHQEFQLKLEYRNKYDLEGFAREAMNRGWNRPIKIDYTKGCIIVTWFSGEMEWGSFIRENYSDFYEVFLPPQVLS